MSGESNKAMIERLADTATACIDGWANDLKAYYDKMQAGDYDADALVQDAANMWVRTLRDTARLVDVALGGEGSGPPTQGEPPPQQEAEDL
jgi:hypothetical protein